MTSIGHATIILYCVDLYNQITFGIVRSNMQYQMDNRNMSASVCDVDSMIRAVSHIPEDTPGRCTHLAKIVKDWK